MYHGRLWAIVAFMLHANVAIAETSPCAAPAVTAAELDDLEAGLEADPQYLMRLLVKDRAKGEALLRAVQRRRPAARLWAVEVQMLFASDVFTAKGLQGDEKVAHFGHAFEYLQESYEIAVQTHGDSQDMELQAALRRLRLDLALAALEAGAIDTARQHATEALRGNTNRKYWDYGNVVHNGNQILGRCALREGRLADANGYLLKAGATPGSPQLNSFGPQMQLARELLENGERETVLEYLDLVSRFWASDGEQSRLSREHAAFIAEWKREIAEGKVPTATRWQ